MTNKLPKFIDKLKICIICEDNLRKVTICDFTELVVMPNCHRNLHHTKRKGI